MYNNKKSYNSIRKIVCLFLVLIISTNSMAAVVSDNDGSAFITKAEFDSLKNSFQAEINTFNTSIDNKIDQAIASYLQGIKIERKSKLKSTLEVAGQTYNGTKRKSYVFAGNNTNNLFCRYNDVTREFIQVTVWDAIPSLLFDFRAMLSSYGKRPSGVTANGIEMYGSDQFQFSVSYEYSPRDSEGNVIPTSGNAAVFITDANNYVKSYKLNCRLQGRGNCVAQTMSNVAEIMAMPFAFDDAHKWKFTYKDIVGANGTSGMGYSTRALGIENAVSFTGYLYHMFANETNPRYGFQYLGKTTKDRSGTVRYLMNYGSSTEPYSVDFSTFNVNKSQTQWLDTHWHFEESRYGDSYAWCMPFGHLIERKVPCFKQWPAWESINWANVSTQNVGTVNSAPGKYVNDTSGNHHWFQNLSHARMYNLNGLSSNFYGATYNDVSNFIEFDGMLPIWKENPLKDWRLLKNSSIKNALSIDAFYAAAPPLTKKFDNAGTFTWVAKINQQDVERIPGRTWSNWGNNRIYFTSKPMDDIEYDGANVKVSNTKKFQFKKHDTTDAWADCQSQVIDGKTYYYQTLEHDTYYDFKMDVESKETTYYMIFDEARPDDYCLEVIEHPDYQIEFEEKSN